jgi:hypothetical protein
MDRFHAARLLGPDSRGRLLHHFLGFGMTGISFATQGERQVGRTEGDVIDTFDFQNFVQITQADFVFDQMPPGLKAQMLRSDYRAEQFACADGGSDCDAAKLRQELDSAGFTDIAVGGNWRGAPVEDSSPILVFRAQRSHRLFPP